MTETCVQHFKIDLPAASPDSFEGFKALVGQMFHATCLHPDQPFQAHAVTTCLPDIYLTHTEAGGTRYERDAKVIARTGTDAIVVLVYLNTGFTLGIDGRQEYVGANEILFFDLRYPITIQAERVNNLSLVISRRRLEEVSPSVKDIHGYVLRSGATHELLLAHMKSCVALDGRIPVADAAVIGDLTIRMVAACWNTMLRHTTTEMPQAGLASLSDIKPFIDNHLGDPQLGPAKLQQEFNLSRATLYRLFEPLGGVAAYILERRMHRAYQAMTEQSGHKPRVKQLALELGFAHASAFSRAFKKQFGVSPLDVLQGQAIPHDASVKPWKIPQALQPLVSAGSRPDKG